MCERCIVSWRHSLFRIQFNCWWAWLCISTMHSSVDQSIINNFYVDYQNKLHCLTSEKQKKTKDLKEHLFLVFFVNFLFTVSQWRCQFWIDLLLFSNKHNYHKCIISNYSHYTELFCMFPRVKLSCMNSCPLYFSFIFLENYYNNRMWVCLGSNEMLHGTKKLYNCPPFIIINTARYIYQMKLYYIYNVHGSWLKVFVAEILDFLRLFVT